jgi:GT2 family glycosyltransferase
MIKTALVILNWNGLGYLKQFLGTVCKHTDNDSIIYVADNGSTDGSSDWVSENFSNVKLIRLDKNFGFIWVYQFTIASSPTKNESALRIDLKRN